MSSVMRNGGTDVPSHVKGGIDRLMVRYCTAIDNGEYEIWPTLFTADGEYRLTTRTDFEAGRGFGIWYCNNRGMLEDRVLALRSVNVYEPHVYRHVIGPTEITDLGEGSCNCETNYIVIRTDIDGDMTVFSTGRYIDQLSLEDGAALLRSRIVVCDSARFDTLVALPI